MTDLLATQRTMRLMRRAAMGRGVAAVLDVGSSKVACFVLRLEGPPGAPEDEIGPMGGQGRVRVIGAAATRSRGVRFGEIATMRETEAAIRTVVQAAQGEAGERVDHVMACLAGADPRSYGLAGATMVRGEVSEADVARAMASCEPPEMGAGRHVLHAQPVHFALDHRAGLADPRGAGGPAADLRHASDERGRARRARRRGLRQALRPGARGADLLGLRLGALGTGGGRAGVGRGLPRHRGRRDLAVDLPAPAHGVRRLRADGRRPRDARCAQGPPDPHRHGRAPQDRAWRGPRHGPRRPRDDRAGWRDRGTGRSIAAPSAAPS